MDDKTTAEPPDLNLDLDQRDGLPDELLFLLERHPRAGWQSDGGLGMTAQFWLERHAAFRQLGQALQAQAEAFRHGGTAPEDFQARFAPRLQMLLSELHGHHQVEDLHYFPVFRQAEPRLEKGFEILDRDHVALHESLVETAEAATALLQALARDPAAAEGPAETYTAAGQRLLTRLLRHLDDEEDLVIPLLIARGNLG